MLYYKFLANKLYSLSSRILECYKKISELEKTGAFDKIPETIKVTEAIIGEENQIYDELRENMRLLASLDAFIHQSKEIYFPDELEFIKRQDESDLIMIRIARRINDILLTNPFTEEEFQGIRELASSDDSENEEFQNLENVDGQIIQERFSKEADLAMAVEKDIVTTILVMLGKYIEDENYADISNILIKLKAYLALIYPSVEKTLLEDNFKIPSSLFWTSYLTGNHQATGVSTVKNLIIDNVISVIVNQIEAYYSAIDETDAEIKRVEIAFTEIVLRSCMIFFTDSEITEIKKSLSESLDELAIEPDINDSLNRVFKNRNVDSTLPFILSLDPKFFEN